MILGNQIQGKFLRFKRVAGAKGKSGGGGESEGETGKSSNKKQPSSVSEEMEFVRLFMTFNADERGLIGHDIMSFIKACRFRGRSCDLRRYVLFLCSCNLLLKIILIPYVYHTLTSLCTLNFQRIQANQCCKLWKLLHD